MIGYGLDFAERYRNLPYVAVLTDQFRRINRGLRLRGQCVTGRG